MTTNVTYENKQTIPSGRRLIFSKQHDDQVVSESIKLVFKFKLDQLARKPIELIRLRFVMLTSQYYEFESKGSIFYIDYTNKSDDFTADEIKLKIKIIDPKIVLDQEVIFQVTVADDAEKLYWPVGGNLGFYSWEPIPPPIASLLKNIPFNLT